MARLVRLVGLVAIALAVAAGPALSAGGGSSGGSSAKPADPNFSQAVSLIDAGKYADAIPLLQKVIEAKPQSADAFNYLGYSHRKIGEFEVALTYYQRALELQPRHLGANEYLGELYLQMDELAKAEERLDVLDDACFFGCEEYSELKEAIKAYKTHQGAS